jgi:hypothetical protein
MIEIIRSKHDFLDNFVLKISLETRELSLRTRKKPFSNRLDFYEEGFYKIIRRGTL